VIVPALTDLADLGDSLRLRLANYERELDKDIQIVKWGRRVERNVAPQIRSGMCPPLASSHPPGGGWEWALNSWGCSAFLGVFSPFDPRRSSAINQGCASQALAIAAMTRLVCSTQCLMPKMPSLASSQAFGDLGNDEAPA
jgi:hypothetical protein